MINLILQISSEESNNDIDQTNHIDESLYSHVSIFCFDLGLEGGCSVFCCGSHDEADVEEVIVVAEEHTDVHQTFPQSIPATFIWQYNHIYTRWILLAFFIFLKSKQPGVWVIFVVVLRSFYVFSN